MLSEHLGIPFYDKELIAEVAVASGLSDELLENMDEFHTNSLLYSIVMNAQKNFTLGSRKPLELVIYDANIAAVKNVAANVFFMFQREMEFQKKKQQKRLTGSIRTGHLFTTASLKRNGVKRKAMIYVSILVGFTR